MVFTDGPRTPTTQLRLVVARTDGSGRRVLPYGTVTRDIDGPSFAPDGRRIVFADLSGDGLTDQLRTAGLGSKSTRLLRSRRREFISGPQWSPRADRIVYGAANSVNVVDARSGRVISAILERGTGPDWSPDGTRIAYSTGSQIDVVAANGRHLHTIVPATDNVGVWSPAWSPNGRSIAWIRVDPGPGDTAIFSIWRARVDGGNAQQVAEIGGVSDASDFDYVAPDLAWQPRPRG
jgi:Tol biopolymer transport system component